MADETEVIQDPALFAELAELEHELSDDTDESSEDLESSTSSGEGETPAPAPTEPPPPAAPPAAATPTPAEGTTAAQPPAPPSPEPVKPEVTTSVAPPKAEESPTVSEPPAEPYSMSKEELERLQAHRQQIAETIASRYSFTEEEQEALQTEPHTVLPKMVGRLYLDVFDGVMGAVMAQVPQLIQQDRAFTSARQASEEKFYQTWPALRGADVKRITGIVTAYRQANPKASLDQVIQEAGAMAHVALGIPVAQATPAATPSQSPPLRPPIPVAPGASAGAPAGVQRQPTLWEELIKEE